MIGILLANTGSPKAPTPAALRCYLAQFLADRHIVDLPPWLWLPILHGVILNTRPARSARLYQPIWTAEGAPLLAISQRITLGIKDCLANRLNIPLEIDLGMRYGDPSIAFVMGRMRQQGCKRFLVLPLFPQFSTVTSASIWDAVLAVAGGWQPRPSLRLVSAYHHRHAYLQALKDAIQTDWVSNGRPQRLLFSFHGLPESTIRRGDPYPQQCQETASQVAEALKLSPNEWQVSYQSRFGPAPWLKPYTDQTLGAWGAEGLSSLGVVCPGFAADCLETLEEIGHTGKQIFQRAGGGEYRYIPALNDRPSHIQALSSIIETELSTWMD